MVSSTDFMAQEQILTNKQIFIILLPSSSFFPLSVFGRRFVSNLHVSRTSPSSPLPVMPFEMGKNFFGQHSNEIYWARHICDVVNMMNKTDKTSQRNERLFGASEKTDEKKNANDENESWSDSAMRRRVLCVCVRDNRTLSRLDAVRSERQVSWVRMVAILRWRTSYLSVTGITHPNNLRKKCHESHTQHFAVAEIGAFHAKSFRSQYDVTEWM